MKFKFYILILVSSTFDISYAEENRRTIPEEFESVGGFSQGFANSGSVAMGGVNAVRLNPAMLTVDRDYSVNAGYHWPSSGRDFYKLGAVDGKTATMGAGLSYTGFRGTYDSKATTREIDPMQDSPMRRRAALGFAYPVFRGLSLGIGGQYIETDIPVSYDELSDERLKAFTAQVGAVWQIVPAFRLGVSAENLANEKVKEVAPTFMRAGAAWIVSKDASLHLDFVRRERSSLYEGNSPVTSLLLNTASEESKERLNPEELVFTTGAFRMQNLLRIMGAYGREIAPESDTPRQLWGAGIALVQDNFSLAYLLSSDKPYRDSLHHVINLSVTVKM
jgi:hypothetical protein